MAQKIQIDLELFHMLCNYHLMGDTSDEATIATMLSDKLDRMANRQIYSTYKTASDPESKEEARQNYLDRKNIPDGFRW